MLKENAAALREIRKHASCTGRKKPRTPLKGISAQTNDFKLSDSLRSFSIALTAFEDYYEKKTYTAIDEARTEILVRLR